MHHTLDVTLRYRGYHGCPSHCRIRVFEPDAEKPWEKGRPPVVIASECPDNPGTSITNRIEQIATLVYQMLERPETGFILIEHYPDRARVGGRPLFREDFDRVELLWDRRCGFVSPKWVPLPKQDLETLIGGKI